MAFKNLTGVLLVNLGSPASPDPAPVRRFLREFLSDPRVLTLPTAARWLLLNLVILPIRPRRTAKAYRQVWLPGGSPLLVHSRAHSEEVARSLGDGFRVELAMRYGSPSIMEGLAALEGAGATRLIVLPLFPQYASAVTASISAAVFAALDRHNDCPPLEILGPFFDEPDFAGSWAALAGPGLREFHPDHVVFSYHGLPEDQIRSSDPAAGHCLASPDCCQEPGRSLPRCYRAQCYATTRGLVEALGVDAEQTSSSFQSRLGRVPWIQPATNELMAELAERGVRRLAVFCPSFVADCLETLEEVGIRLRADWHALGGKDFWLAPCPNGDAGFAEAVAGWIRRRVPAPRP